MGRCLHISFGRPHLTRRSCSSSFGALCLVLGGQGRQLRGLTVAATTVPSIRLSGEMCGACYQVKHRSRPILNMLASGIMGPLTHTAVGEPVYTHAIQYQYRVGLSEAL